MKILSSSWNRNRRQGGAEVVDFLLPLTLLGETPTLSCGNWTLSVGSFNSIWWNFTLSDVCVNQKFLRSRWNRNRRQGGAEVVDFLLNPFCLRKPPSATDPRISRGHRHFPITVTLCCRIKGWVLCLVCNILKSENIPGNLLADRRISRDQQYFLNFQQLLLLVVIN